MHRLISIYIPRLLLGFGLKGLISFELESELKSLIFKMVNFLYWELLSPFFQVLLKKKFARNEEKTILQFTFISFEFQTMGSFHVKLVNLKAWFIGKRCLELSNSIN